MYVKSIDVKEIFRSKKTKFVVAVVSVIFIIVVAIYSLGKVNNMLNGISIKNIIEYIGEKQENIFNMTSYEAEYTMIVVSNKNMNSYNIKELYDKGKTRYEYLDSNNLKVTVIINKDKIKIENGGQKNIMIEDFKTTMLSNNISISTFLELYKEIKDKNSIQDNNESKSESESVQIEVKEYLKNEYLKVVMTVKKCDKGNRDEERLYNIFKDISRIELEVDEKTKLPSTYVVYNKNKKEVVSIIYNKFNINTEIDSKLFNIY